MRCTTLGMKLPTSCRMLRYYTSRFEQAAVDFIAKAVHSVANSCCSCVRTGEFSTAAAAAA
eukprot:1310450-Amphidinium_carterae.1